MPEISIAGNVDYPGILEDAGIKGYCLFGLIITP